MPHAGTFRKVCNIQDLGFTFYQHKCSYAYNAYIHNYILPLRVYLRSSFPLGNSYSHIIQFYKLEHSSSHHQFMCRFRKIFFHWNIRFLFEFSFEKCFLEKENYKKSFLFFLSLFLRRIFPHPPQHFIKPITR